MSLHIEANRGQIAETILLPGDPLRAKFIAEHMLEEVECYNKVRNMNGYTGLYNGVPVSVQGTGMGIPSTSIYANELIATYGVNRMIRIGTCGSIQSNVKIGDLILAITACTDSNINRIQFNSLDYAPNVDFSMLRKAYDLANENKFKTYVGPIFSTDTFYDNVKNRWDIWMEHGVLAVEMETSALYTIAAKHGIQALSILTVSDHIISGEVAGAKAREQEFMNMAKIAMELAV